MRADKSLSPFEIRVYRHYRIVHGTRVALAFLLTFLIIRLFTIPESTWPLVTMVVIMGPISGQETVSRFIDWGDAGNCCWFPDR